MSYKAEPSDASEHIEQIVDDVSSDVETKYMAGQDEHGGKLWRKPVLDFMGEEVTDMNVYFHVLKYQNHKMKLIAQEGLQGACDPAVALQKVFNVLTIGNEDGIRESGD